MTKRLRHAAIAGAAVAAICVLSGCSGAGGSSTSQPGAAKAVSTKAANTSGKVPGPCDLVTAADVTKVMNAAVGPSHFNDAGISALCSYPSANQTDDDSEFNVGITVVKDSQSKTDFEDFPGATVTHVSGIGDDALWDADKSTLYVLKNGRVIEIGVTGPTDALAARAQDLSTQLAQIAVTRF